MVEQAASQITDCRNRFHQDIHPGKLNHGSSHIGIPRNLFIQHTFDSADNPCYHQRNQQHEYHMGKCHRPALRWGRQDIRHRTVVHLRGNQGIGRCDYQQEDRNQYDNLVIHRVKDDAWVHLRNLNSHFCHPLNHRRICTACKIRLDGVNRNRYHTAHHRHNQDHRQGKKPETPDILPKQRP